MFIPAINNSTGFQKCLRNNLTASNKNKPMLPMKAPKTWMDFFKYREKPPPLPETPNKLPNAARATIKATKRQKIHKNVTNAGTGCTTIIFFLINKKLM